jgi:hypothetical protein
MRKGIPPPPTGDRIQSECCGDVGFASGDAYAFISTVPGRNVWRPANSVASELGRRGSRDGIDIACLHEDILMPYFSDILLASRKIIWTFLLRLPWRIGFLACSHLELWILWLLWRGISPSQGGYLHRTTQTQKKCRHIRASSGIRIHVPSVRLGEDMKWKIIQNI